MKSQLVILLILVSSLLATNADQQCDNLLQQYVQFRNECTPALITINSCCDLIGFPLNNAPSAVYQTKCKCGGRFTTADMYCDMEAGDEGGWMVIQRNIKDGVDTFHKTWREFEVGFGELTDDKFWYGLMAMNCFMEKGQWELRIDFQFENKTWSYLHYMNFSIGSASQEYLLTIRGFTGTTTDPFVTQPLNGVRFSTFDNDNDESVRNCAASFGGWWYNRCSNIAPNRQPPYVRLNSKNYYPLSMEIKIRPRDCITQ